MRKGQRKPKVPSVRDGSRTAPVMHDHPLVPSSLRRGSAKRGVVTICSGDVPIVAKAAGEPPLINDVATLSDDLRELVRRMLIEGATFEDVQEALAERGTAATLQAVQNYFRGDLELQKQRVQFQLDRVNLLKAGLANPESAESQLAHAAILTGLQSLSRGGGELSVRDSVRASLERQNLMLKRTLTRLKIRREQEDERFKRTKLRAELTKWHCARMKLVQLRRQLMKETKTSDGLGPEALEKIQEIYGLLRIPLVPRDPDRPSADL